MPPRTFIAREASAWLQIFQRTASLSLGAHAAGDLKLKSVFTDHSRNPRTPKNCVTSTQPVLRKWTAKSGQRLQHGLLNILNPLFRRATQEEKDVFQNITAH